MIETQSDLNSFLMLDGNAAAGILDEIFAMDMTASPVECAHCGQEGPIGTLLVFMSAPGIVLRCPGCENVIMRIVQTSEAIYLDARGARYLRLQRTINH